MEWFEPVLRFVTEQLLARHYFLFSVGFFNREGRRYDSPVRQRRRKKRERETDTQERARSEQCIDVSLVDERNDDDDPAMDADRKDLPVGFGPISTWVLFFLLPFVCVLFR